MFSGWKQAYVRMEPSKTNQTRWKWHHNTSTPSLRFVPFCQLCLVFICVHRRVVEGIGMGSAAWECSACSCAWRSHVGGYYWFGMADVVCLVCRSCGVHERCWVLYGMLECQLSCELLFLLNMVHMVVLHVKGCWVSSAEYLVGV